MTDQAQNTNETPAVDTSTVTTNPGNISATSSTVNDNTSAIETRFVDTLPDDVRNEPSLQNYKDAGSMAKSLVNAQKELGSRIRIPGPDASPEIKSEFIKKLENVPGILALPDRNDKASVDSFLTKLGRPTSPDGYDIQIAPEVLEAVPAYKEMIPQFKELAHNLGLNKEQAQALVQFEASRTEQVIDKMLNDKETTTNTLKEVWGNEFSNRLESSKEVFTHYSTKYPDAVKSLLNGVEGNNPVVLMMASELGKMYKESGVITGNREVNYGLTPDEAKSRIAEVMGNPAHDYYSDNARVRGEAISKVEELYKAAYPGGKE